MIKNNLKLYLRQPGGRCEGPYYIQQIREMVLSGDIDEHSELAKGNLFKRDDFESASMVLSRHKELSDIVYRLRHDTIMSTVATETLEPEHIAPVDQGSHEELEATTETQAVAPELNIDGYYIVQPNGVSIGPYSFRQMYLLYERGELTMAARASVVKGGVTRPVTDILKDKPQVVCRAIDIGCDRVASDQTLKGLKYGLKIDCAVARQMVELEATALVQEGYRLVSVVPITAALGYKGSKADESGSTTIGFLLTACLS